MCTICFSQHAVILGFHTYFQSEWVKHMEGVLIFFWIMKSKCRVS